MTDERGGTAVSVQRVGSSLNYINASPLFLQSLSPLLSSSCLCLTAELLSDCSRVGSPFDSVHTAGPLGMAASGGINVPIVCRFGAYLVKTAIDWSLR